MKVRRMSAIDSFVYIALCILSFGSVWFMRVIITKAIECAFDDR